jgi:hypothetical protein
MQQMDNFIKENNVEKNIVPKGEVLNAMFWRCASSGSF